jgi:DNA-directed RNA polymerase specialized sigma24 family protein
MALGLPPGTVAATLKRALAKLRVAATDATPQEVSR